MFDWILFTVAPMVLIAMIAVPVALLLAVCMDVSNCRTRRAARQAAEAAGEVAEPVEASCA